MDARWIDTAENERVTVAPLKTSSTRKAVRPNLRGDLEAVGRVPGRVQSVRPGAGGPRSSGRSEPGGGGPGDPGDLYRLYTDEILVDGPSRS